MPFEQQGFEQEVVNRIRSIYNTVDSYRRTSQAAHGRLSESAIVHANNSHREVQNIASKWKEYPEIQRWAQKLDEYLKQYGMLRETKK